MGLVRQGGGPAHVMVASQQGPGQLNQARTSKSIPPPLSLVLQLGNNKGFSFSDGSASLILLYVHTPGNIFLIAAPVATYFKTAFYLFKQFSKNIFFCSDS